MYKIAVCIKQIPLVEDASFDPQTKRIRRDGPAVISAFDLRAISVAVDLKSRLGAETVVVTMGPPQARAAPTDALAMGIDRAAHLEDAAFAGSDTLATARALSFWLRPQKFDLILLGKYTLDAETGQVGPEVAELLGIAQITGARKLEIDGRRIRAERESDEGFDEIECSMPAVVTCAERLAAPIRVTPEQSEQAKAKPIETVRASDLSPNRSDFGLAGSPTWVQSVQLLKTPKSRCMMIEAADPVRAASQLVAELDRIGALTARRKTRLPVSSQVRKPARGKDLWVACETNLAGEITRATLELLSQADRLASTLGGAVAAVGTSLPMTRHASLLAAFGADLVIAVDSPALDPYSPEIYAEAMAHLVVEHRPWGLLMSASERGRDWGPRLAARLGLGLTGDAIGIEIDKENRMVALKPAFGGNVVAPILSNTYPQMATVRAGVLELAEPQPSRVASLQTVRPQLGNRLTVLVRQNSTLDASVVSLEGADVVVGAGTGVGGPDGIAKLKELARVLGAGMCATRRVTDAGWMPRQLQVGLTGKAIDPRLYFAVGIRGAPNHTVGIKRAQTIVAINSDPAAPIFEHSTFGLIGDWSVLIPAMIDALRSRLNA
jgi:electron transfer flavoprotein alpha subunit